MARKKEGLADAVTDIVSRLPWWAGVALAAVLYVVLHRVATLPLPGPQAGQMGNVALGALWRALAAAGQYVLPFFCLFGAGVSAWRRRHGKQLVANVSRSDAADALNGMRWQEFERLVGEGFRLQGYRVVETGGGGADGGVDLVLHKDGETFVVQCKQWRALRVGVDVVRQLYGVMAARGAAGGFVVTSGRFTDEARQFAEGRNVQLVDGPRLHGLIQRASGISPPQQPAGSTPSGRQQTVPTTQPVQAEPTVVTTPPACPVCGQAMVRRTSRRGPFWGCSAYPACKGTRPIG